MHRRYLPALILTLAFAACAAAQSRPVWQIGEFNGSSDEFGAQAAAGPFDAAGGRAQDWGATQQAVVEAKADPAAARRIRFELTDAPGGVYTLTMHPEIIGRGHRMLMLERLVAFFAAQEGVAFATCGERCSPAAMRICSRTKSQP